MPALTFFLNVKKVKFHKPHHTEAIYSGYWCKIKLIEWSIISIDAYDSNSYLIWCKIELNLSKFYKHLLTFGNKFEFKSVTCSNSISLDQNVGAAIAMVSATQLVQLKSS